MNIYEFREQHREYDDLSDQDLAKRLHAKHYSDLPYDDFANRFGVGVGVGGFFGDIGEAMTGARRSTPEMENLQEIGAAPELDQFNMDAFKASANLNFALGDDQAAEEAVTKIGGSLRRDPKGNTIVDLPSGSYALNKPGFSYQDFLQLGSTLGLYGIGGSLAGAGKTMLSTMGRQAVGAGASNIAQQKLRGEESIDPLETGIITGLGGAGSALPLLGKLPGVASSAGRAFKQRFQSPINPADNQLIQAGENLNIPIFKGDLSPRTAKIEQFVQQVPFSGGVKAHEQRLVNTQDAVKRFNQSHRVTDDAGAMVQKSLEGRLSRFKQLEGARYNRVDAMMKGSGPVALPKYKTALQVEIKKFANKDTPVGRQVSERLKQWASNKPRSFSDARDLRSDLLAAARDAEKAADTQIGSQGVAALKRVAQSVDEDLSRFIIKQNPEAYKLWREANAGWKEGNILYQGARGSTKVAKRALDTAEMSKIPKMIMTSPSKEKTLELYNALGADGRKGVYQGLLDDAYQTSMNENAGQLMYGRYASQLRKILDNAGPFVQGANRAELEGLAKVVRHVMRSAEAVSNPKTGFAAIAPTATGAGVGASFASGSPMPIIIGALIARMGNQFLMKPATKEFLKKAAKLDPNSPKFAQLFSEYTAKIAVRPTAYGLTQAQMDQITAEAKRSVSGVPTLNQQ